MLLSRLFVISLFITAFFMEMKGQLDSVRVEIYGTENIEVFSDMTISNDTIYAVGYTTVCGSSDMMIAVYDTSLNLLHNYNIGETYSIESLSGVCSKNDTVYFAGSTNNTYNNGYDILYGSLNRKGEIQESVTLSAGNWVFCNAINSTSDGGFIGVGKTLSSDSSWNGLIFKVDANLDINWIKSIGGVEDDIFYDFVMFNDSIVVACGETSSAGNGAKDVWIYSCLIDGTFLWENEIGGLNDDWANSIIKTNDNAMCLFGTTSSYNSTTEDTYLVKIDSLGQFQWSNLHQVQTIYNVFPDNGFDLIQLSTGDYIVFSVLQSFGYPGVENISIMRTNGTGDWQEAEFFAGYGADKVSRAYKYNDTTIFFCGSTSSYGAGKTDALIGVLPYIPTFKTNHKTNVLAENCFTAIDEISEGFIKVYPNPFISQLNIELPDEGNIENIQLLNVAGQIVQGITIDSNTVNVSSNLESGVYLLTFTYSGVPKSKLVIRE